MVEKGATTTETPEDRSGKDADDEEADEAADEPQDGFASSPFEVQAALDESVINGLDLNSEDISNPVAGRQIAACGRPNNYKERSCA